ncbi:hypothetical protein BDF22DRAFT_653255 [Syncephalis plumigaleata]|nr:hypothetical protein BDF22DRAFT_653255 [Syncephalis plumigaleata]
MSHSRSTLAAGASNTGNVTDNSSVVSSQPGVATTLSPALMQQVIAERDALREQNDQLWKIIEKQRNIIQQLQLRNGELQEALNNLQLNGEYDATTSNQLDEVDSKNNSNTTVTQNKLVTTRRRSGSLDTASSTSRSVAIPPICDIIAESDDSELRRPRSASPSPLTLNSSAATHTPQHPIVTPATPRKPKSTGNGRKQPLKVTVPAMGSLQGEALSSPFRASPEHPDRTILSRASGATRSPISPSMRSPARMMDGTLSRQGSGTDLRRYGSLETVRTQNRQMTSPTPSPRGQSPRGQSPRLQQRALPHSSNTPLSPSAMRQRSLEQLPRSRGTSPRTSGHSTPQRQASFEQANPTTRANGPLSTMMSADGNNGGISQPLPSTLYSTSIQSPTPVGVHQRTEIMSPVSTSSPITVMPIATLSDQLPCNDNNDHNDDDDRDDDDYAVSSPVDEAPPPLEHQQQPWDQHGRLTTASRNNDIVVMSSDHQHQQQQHKHKHQHQEIDEINRMSVMVQPPSSPQFFKKENQPSVPVPPLHLTSDIAVNHSTGQSNSIVPTTTTTEVDTDSYMTSEGATVKVNEKESSANPPTYIESVATRRMRNTGSFRLSRADMPPTILHQIDSMAEQLQESVQKHRDRDGATTSSIDPSLMADVDSSSIHSWHDDIDTLAPINLANQRSEERDSVFTTNATIDSMDVEDSEEGFDSDGFVQHENDHITESTRPESVSSLPLNETSGRSAVISPIAREPASPGLAKASSFSGISTNNSNNGSILMNAGAPIPRGPVLHKPIEPLTSIKGVAAFVVSSGFAINDKGREVSMFVLAVTRIDPAENNGEIQELWRVEKEYVQFVKLDTLIKHKQPRKILNAIGKLPEKSLFTGHAPHKVDQRKVALEMYLQGALSSNTSAVDALCTFLSTNVKYPDKGITPEGYKEGYLTKRGKNFGGWKKRYFMLRSPVLEYYESREGQRLGTIPLRHCQVMKQQVRQRDHDEKAYRHAFMIIEAKKNSNVTRHVFCAEDDEERDSWVYCLSRYTGQQQAHDDSIDSFASGSTGTEDASNPSLGRGKLRKMSKNEHTTSNNSNGSNGNHKGGNHGTHSASSSLSDSAAFAEPKSTNQPLSAVDEDVEQSTSRQHMGMPNNDYQHHLHQHQHHHLHHGGSSAPAPVNYANAEHHATSSAQQQQGAQAPPNGQHINRVATHNTMPGSMDMDVPHNSNSGNANNTSPSRPGIAASGREIDRREQSSPPVDIKSTFTSSDRSTTAHAQPSQVSTLQQTNSNRKDAVPTSTQKKKGFWGRMFTGGESGRRLTHQPVFGVPLEKAIEVSRVKEGFECPAVIYRTIEYLEAKQAEHEEGIYRLSGSTAVVRQLREKFDNYSDYNIVGSNEYYDVHAVAGVLKMYLRELPINVLTRELHPQFLKVLDNDDRRIRVNELGKLVSQLPLANYTLLRTLIAHLIRIVRKSDINKMTIRNVGIVFSPTLNIPAGVFALFMAQFDYIFFVDADGMAKPRMVAEGEELLGERVEATRHRVIPPRVNTDRLNPANSNNNTLQSNNSNSNSNSGLQSTSATSTLPVSASGHLTVMEERSSSNGRSKRNSLIYQSVAPELVQLEQPLNDINHTSIIINNNT